MSFQIETSQLQFAAGQQIGTGLSALWTLKPIVFDWKCQTAFSTPRHSRQLFDVEATTVKWRSTHGGCETKRQRLRHDLTERTYSQTNGADASPWIGARFLPNLFEQRFDDGHLMHVTSPLAGAEVIVNRFCGFAAGTHRQNYCCRAGHDVTGSKHAGLGSFQRIGIRFNITAFTRLDIRRGGLHERITACAHRNDHNVEW